MPKTKASARPDGYPKTTELDRMGAVKDDSHKIGEFIDWLEANGFWICERHAHQGSDDKDEPTGCWAPHECTALCFCSGPHPHDPAKKTGCVCLTEVSLICGRSDGEYYSTNKTPEKLLASYFKIDLNKTEDERQAIIEWLSKKNEAPKK